jgi:hypothetical protein
LAFYENKNIMKAKIGFSLSPSLYPNLMPCMFSCFSP